MSVRSWGLGAMGAAAVLATATLIAAPAPAPATVDSVRIDVLSSRPDTVSGGDALIRVNDAVEEVTVNGVEVTASFDTTSDGSLVGLVRGLRPGENNVIAATPTQSAQLTLTNHSAAGPVLSGEQVQPWLCSTRASGLGDPSDRRTCHTESRFDLFYRSSLTGSFASYDPAAPPPDVDTTVTDAGTTVPFIVRVETGTLNRAVYKIATLYDPASGTERDALRGYAGKALVPFGAGCWPKHVQGRVPNVLGDGPVTGLIDGSLNAARALSQGFAVFSSSSNNFENACNTNIAAETLMMVKERLIERTGEPLRYTLGQGCSGGSVQQFVLAAAYPGLLDGLIPMCSFPDLGQVSQTANDCTLMNRVFNEVSPHLWPVLAQRSSTQGYASPASCVAFAVGTTRWQDPTNHEACGLPQEQVYDPHNNPDGVRCTLQDNAVATFGRRPSDGFATRPYDNVGVQYGLHTLESGIITPGQFVDLNTNIGGLDIDARWQPQRSKADPTAIARAYRSGWVMSGDQLADVPILELRGTDAIGNHTDVHSYSVRARLERDTGSHANHVLWTGLPPLLSDPAANEAVFDIMDSWLGGIEADHSALPLAEKVARNKPLMAVDSCWIGGRRVTDPSTCRTAFPYFADPRLVAGAPMTDDVVKCQLKPLERSDYTVPFTDNQWQRLQVAFPTGVCEYDVPGVDQQPTVPWLDYSTTPGGEPLGPVPQTVAYGEP